MAGTEYGAASAHSVLCYHVPYHQPRVHEDERGSGQVYDMAQLSFPGHSDTRLRTSRATMRGLIAGERFSLYAGDTAPALSAEIRPHCAVLLVENSGPTCIGSDV